VRAAQLDRLAGVIGLDTLEQNVVPFPSLLKTLNDGFWTGLALLAESAVYGAYAQNVISHARRAWPRAEGP